MEGTTSVSYVIPYCNGGSLADDSMCCAGDSIECQNKPCFDGWGLMDGDLQRQVFDR